MLRQPQDTNTPLSKSRTTDFFIFPLLLWLSGFFFRVFLGRPNQREGGRSSFREHGTSTQLESEMVGDARQHSHWTGRVGPHGRAGSPQRPPMGSGRCWFRGWPGCRARLEKEREIAENLPAKEMSELFLGAEPCQASEITLRQRLRYPKAKDEVLEAIIYLTTQVR